jgi:hypothetical protein
MKWPSRRLLFAASLAVPLLASGQALHQNPRWPADGEFLSVNQVVETACQRHRESATSRLGQEVSEYIHSSIPH